MVLKPCARPTFLLPIIQFYYFLLFFIIFKVETLQHLPHIVLSFSVTFFMADN